MHYQKIIFVYRYTTRINEKNVQTTAKSASEAARISAVIDSMVASALLLIIPKIALIKATLVPTAGAPTFFMNVFNSATLKSFQNV